MTYRPSVHTLASAIAVAFVTAFAAPPSLAQTAPSSHFQVLEFDYAPASPTPGLDLRPGRYLLQLRRDGVDAYEGVLRGPGNELIAESFPLSAAQACTAGVGSDAQLSTRARRGQRGLNVLDLHLRSDATACSLQGSLPLLGLTAPQKPPQELECAPPEEVRIFGQTDNDPACAPPPPPPQLPIAAKPELRPGGKLRIAGSQAEWTSVLPLDASLALARENGRCVFDYAAVVENSGWTRSAPSDASILLERRLGLQLDAQQLPALAPGARHLVTGTLALPPGLWRVFLHADSRGVVGEYDALNNARSALVEVLGDCSAP